jgi:hypothetical protein
MPRHAITLICSFLTLPPLKANRRKQLSFRARRHFRVARCHQLKTTFPQQLFGTYTLRAYTEQPSHSLQDNLSEHVLFQAPSTIAVRSGRNHVKWSVDLATKKTSNLGRSESRRSWAKSMCFSCCFCGHTSAKNLVINQVTKRARRRKMFTAPNCL